MPRRPRPDAGLILQETRPQPERAPGVTLPPIQAPGQPRAPVPAAGGDVRVQVTHFEFSGNSALSSEILSEAVAAWAGRALTFGDLIQAVEAVEARYKEEGFFLAQGYLPPQKIKDGAIEIAISEGRMGEARLQGESRVSADVFYTFLDPLPKGQALTLPVLERQVLLINELAGAAPRSICRPASSPAAPTSCLRCSPSRWSPGAPTPTITARPPPVRNASASTSMPTAISTSASASPAAC
ncbi:MAG: ShlB/FhaC/HecB family hemolysin secretion/activation protein [Betaproteobacteria bacterium]|nr:ShlB/FhaC/HecB family hemolysin secretion/activation protein [Betaproteobacteria bacterium]